MNLQKIKKNMFLCRRSTRARAYIQRQRLYSVILFSVILPSVTFGYLRLGFHLESKEKQHRKTRCCLYAVI